MTRRVSKHELMVPGTTHLMLPAGTELRSVAFQGHRLYVWTAEFRSPTLVEWEFRACETGDYEPEFFQHIATAHGLRGRPYVAHVYARAEVMGR